MVVLAPKVHDTEDLGGLGVLNHHHVALGVVGLDGHTEVVARLVFVSHLKRRLHLGLLLTSPVTAQLQRVVGVEAIGPRPSKCCLSGVEFASYDLLTPHKYWGYTVPTLCLRALHTTDHR